MNRGPQKGARPQANMTFAEKAIAAYGEPTDWVLELAAFADANGLAGAAKAIGYSTSLVSTVISGKYPGDRATVEEKVRGALMGLNVDCPVLGEIGRDRCLKEQATPFRATSAMRASLYHACRNGCPNARRKGDSNDD